MSYLDISNPIIDYLTISNDALTQVKKLLNNKKKDCLGIRVSVRTRGCSGLSYVIEYAIKDKNITKFDDLAKFDDIFIFIDPKVSMFLIGSEMIYQKNDLEEGFDFINPNEKARCGCGESFSVNQ
jgi:iron-sulfur cluster assembly accessory protein|tara:strand:+ start:1194 stop:1568 length:375 start_codon:yes stop_codon:yes gene_type:complete